MQKTKPQLGRGMAALLGGAPGAYLENAEKVSPTGSSKKENQIETQPLLVELEKIVPNKGQPRKIFSSSTNNG